MSEIPAPNGLGAKIAEEIRVLLVRRRRTAVSVAQEAGWTQSYLAHRLTGRQAFSIDDLENIALVLGVKIVDLLPSGEREPTRSYGDRPVPAPRSPLEAAAYPAGGRPPGRPDARHPPPGHRRTAPVRP